MPSPDSPFLKVEKDMWRSAGTNPQVRSSSVFNDIILRDSRNTHKQVPRRFRSV
jgi:hypothetical protein